MNLHQGVRLHLPGDSRCFQVLSVDAPRGRCFVRQLPLTRHGSRVIEISLDTIEAAQQA